MSDRDRRDEELNRVGDTLEPAEGEILRVASLTSFIDVPGRRMSSLKELAEMCPTWAQRDEMVRKVMESTSVPEDQKTAVIALLVTAPAIVEEEVVVDDDLLRTNLQKIYPSQAIVDYVITLLGFVDEQALPGDKRNHLVHVLTTLFPAGTPEAPPVAPATGAETAFATPQESIIGRLKHEARMHRTGYGTELKRRLSAREMTIDDLRSDMIRVDLHIGEDEELARIVDTLAAVYIDIFGPEGIKDLPRAIQIRFQINQASLAAALTDEDRLKMGEIAEKVKALQEKRATLERFLTEVMPAQTADVWVSLGENQVIYYLTALAGEVGRAEQAPELIEEVPLATIRHLKAFAETIKPIYQASKPAEVVKIAKLAYTIDKLSQLAQQLDTLYEDRKRLIAEFEIDRKAARGMLEPFTTRLQHPDNQRPENHSEVIQELGKLEEWINDVVHKWR